MRFVVNWMREKARTSTLASTVLTRLFVLYHVLDFRKAWAVSVNLDRPINLMEPEFGDLRYNFVFRVLSERKYDTVIEIGALEGYRSIHLKKMFPDLRVICSDVQPSFETRGTQYGVEFKPFTIDLFTPDYGKCLVVSIGTLDFLSEIEVNDYFTLLYRNGFDLCLVEHGSPVTRDHSIRRFKLNHHHPYGFYLRKSGFNVDAMYPNDSFSLSAMERQEYVFAFHDQLIR